MCKSNISLQVKISMIIQTQKNLIKKKLWIKTNGAIICTLGSERKVKRRGKFVYFSGHRKTYITMASMHNIINYTNQILIIHKTNAGHTKRQYALFITAGRAHLRYCRMQAPIIMGAHRVVLGGRGVLSTLRLQIQHPQFILPIVCKLLWFIGFDEIFNMNSK